MRKVGMDCPRKAWEGWFSTPFLFVMLHNMSNQNTRPLTKRFIAGAICPKCHAIDTIALYRKESGEEYIQCVKCDYYYDQKDGVPGVKKYDNRKNP
ncbi:MAG: hypothetical protein K0R12_295 [Gammaproteobacteria bacterium]|jgi:uncharacterized metal-binding protein (TIGR02443 family)|nr:hypothetical protein [Gammaproteobacteria bacterium]